MPALTRLEYRTFDTLMSSVRGDLSTLSLEGMINESELINLVRKINFELGLKVNPARVKQLSVINHRAQLPMDFYVLNSVIGLDVDDCRGSEFNYHDPTSPMCFDVHHVAVPLDPSVCEPNVTLLETDYSVVDTTSNISGVIVTPESTTITTTTTGFVSDYRTVDFTAGEIILTHSFTPGTVTVTAVWNGIDIDLSNNVSFPTDTTIKILSYSALAGVKITIRGITGSYTPPVVIPDPVEQLPTTPLTPKNTHLHTRLPSRVLRTVEAPRWSGLLSDSYITSAALAGVNYQKEIYYNQSICWLEGNCLVVPMPYNTILLDYQGAMENDNGELLTLDHPLVNEYYEYALKDRILENLVLNGEQETTRLQLVRSKIREVRNNAISYTRSIDFKELMTVWQAQRRSMYQKFYQPF